MTNSGPTDIDVVVIGAGVIGLAVAASLAKRGREVYVLEREAQPGQGISSRNSEVIHAGIYYPPGSLKARLCVRGKELLYHYCTGHNIPHKRLGKLIVANSDREVQQLKALSQQAEQNGVNDLQLLSAAEAKARQPALQCLAALSSPSTGIVDSHELMQALSTELAVAGGQLVCHTEVASLRPIKNSLEVTLADGTRLSARAVVNCAGLYAVDLAGTVPNLVTPHAQFAKGNYFKLNRKSPFDQLIYPAPVPGGLGVHLTLDLSGAARFGPDVLWLDINNPNDLKDAFTVDAQRAEHFYKEIAKYWPSVSPDDLIEDYAGIRPKLVDHKDFSIQTSKEHNIPGLINLFGFESPGLTAALAIAEHIWLE